MKWLDLPPVWLGAFVLLIWLQKLVLPLGTGFGAAWVAVLGWVCVAAGIGLTALSAVQFQRHRTTIVPHRDANALITSGVYRFSRNPIYLADTLALTGAALILDAPLGLLLVPVFVVVMTTRFIVPEEARLRRKFVEQFDAYRQQTRRWL